MFRPAGSCVSPVDTHSHVLAFHFCAVINFIAYARRHTTFDIQCLQNISFTVLQMPLRLPCLTAFVTLMKIVINRTCCRPVSISTDMLKYPCALHDTILCHIFRIHISGVVDWCGCLLVGRSAYIARYTYRIVLEYMFQYMLPLAIV